MATATIVAGRATRDAVSAAGVGASRAVEAVQSGYLRCSGCRLGAGERDWPNEGNLISFIPPSNSGDRPDVRAGPAT
jgi:hypothetical protein